MSTEVVRGDEMSETYIVTAKLLLLIHLTVVLVDARPVTVWVTTESDVEILQKLVAAGEERFGLVGTRIDRGLAVEDNDAIGKVGRHDEIVLDDEGCLLGVHDEALDDASGNDTLLGVEVAIRSSQYSTSL